MMGILSLTPLSKTIIALGSFYPLNFPQLATPHEVPVPAILLPRNRSPLEQNLKRSRLSAVKISYYSIDKNFAFF